MAYSTKCVFALGLFFGSSHVAPAAAQGGAPSAAAVAPGQTGHVASAVHVTEAPIIDGTLDERVWQEAVPLNGFVQAEPFEGQPGSERTEVRILYDDEAIYVAV